MDLRWNPHWVHLPLNIVKLTPSAQFNQALPFNCHGLIHHLQLVRSWNRIPCKSAQIFKKFCPCFERENLPVSHFPSILHIHRQAKGMRHHWKHFNISLRISIHTIIYTTVYTIWICRKKFLIDTYRTDDIQKSSGGQTLHVRQKKWIKNPDEHAIWHVYSGFYGDTCSFGLFLISKQRLWRNHY